VASKIVEVLLGSGAGEQGSELINGVLDMLKVSHTYLYNYTISFPFLKFCQIFLCVWDGIRGEIA
jgi:hypothetical protein